MYMPNQSAYVNRMSAVTKKPKRNLRAVVLALFVIAAASAWAVWQTGHEEKLGREAQQLLHDAELLWTWSDAELKDGASAAEWTVRWSAFVEPDMAQPFINGLFTDNEGKPQDKLIKDNGRTVAGSLAGYTGQLTVHSIGTSGKGEELMIIYTVPAKSFENKAQLIAPLREVSLKLSKAGSSFSSSMKVHGLTAGSNAIRALAAKSQSEEIDRYEDNGTISVTMFSPLLQQRIAAQNGLRANLQAAAHQADEYSTETITIGVPLITGDYTSAGSLE